MYDIMVVEDSKPMLRNLVSQIEAVESRVRVVETAFDGEEAIGKLERARVDIVFSDIKMPVMDGLSFLSEVKRLSPGTRCVIVSGYDDFQFARQAIQLKIDEYILKPVVAEELGEVLKKLIAGIEAERRTLPASPIPNGDDEARDYSSRMLADAVMAYIKANIYGRLTMADISKRFHVSPSYIHRSMRAANGMTPMEYCMSLRIEEAKRLLCGNGDVLAKDVAEALGFEDQHYFSRVFKKFVGMCPMEYRDAGDHRDVSGDNCAS
jgi:two-component system, response regulator YesN